MSGCESCKNCDMNRPTWSDFIDKMIKQLEKENFADCKGDRLCLAKKIVHVLTSINNSLKGWSQWMNFDKMDELTTEEMEWIIPRLQKVVIEFLEIDKEITKRKEEEAMKEIIEQIEAEKKKAKKIVAKGKYIQ